MLEKQIEKKVCDYAKSLGWRHRKYQTPAYRGAPDRVFYKHPRRVFFIEFKSARGKLSDLQRREIELLQSEGFDVFVVSSVEEGKTILDVMT